ncbi:MAG: uroporphyrinogen-III C-methyltransferase [Gammaproteobacteria bacterium]|nr:uroporphyrinogen-III C-methyltransferase [Gammaproteobacteria bacterium]
MSEELSGISVLVTRPVHQAGNLIGLIQSHGGEALSFPTLQIEANADREAVLATIGDVADYDIAIFISINAVNHGVQYLPAEGKRPLLAAIGPSTARALVEAGFKSDIKATRGFTSEALLRESALRDVSDKKIVIFRGSGGRALLGRELEKRGATVTYAEVYRRDRPEVLDPEIESRLAAGTVDVVTATSSETLFNLYELAEEPSVTGLAQTQLVTTSERVVKKAAALGFERVALLAQGPDDQALVEAILDWRRNSGQSDPVTGTKMTEASTQDRVGSANDKEESVTEIVEENDDEVLETELETATESDKPPVSAPPPRKRGGGALSLLAMLFSLAALAASGYIWWEQQQKDSAATTAQGAAGDAIEATQRDIAALGGRLDQNLSRVSNLDAGRGRLESNIDDLRGSVETLTARVQGAEQSIDAVSGISASARNNWVRAEAEYFLQTANSRLQLAQDPGAALAALQAADDRLKSLGDPTLFRVRQELAGEIGALKAVPRPDMEGIAHTLNGLAARVEELPLNTASPDTYQSSSDVEIVAETPLDRAMSTLGGVFTSMISVKRTDEAATPLLSRDEEFFLKRNLELQLQTARLALLRGEAANYRESLRTARNWLQTHFMNDATSVESAVATLIELEAEDISPNLPDISGSLRLLRLAAAPPDTAPPAEEPVPADTTPESDATAVTEDGESA